MKRLLATLAVLVMLAPIPAIAKPHPVNPCRPGPGRSDFGHSHRWGYVISRGGRDGYCSFR